MEANRAGRALVSAVWMMALLTCAKPDDCGAIVPTPADTPAPPPQTAVATPNSFQIGLQVADSLFDTTKANHVAVVVVSSTGHVFPSRLIVRKKRYKIVWIPDGEKLDVQFADNSLAVDCTSFAPVCVAKVSPQTATGSAKPLKYKGTITKNGVSTPIDPHLEVVP
jgi:hypothetical protein